MKRYFALLIASLGISSAVAEPKPNIIYINVDDLGWSDLGFQGSKYYETPHIDKFSKTGAVFTNAYAPAANCAPSRACCLTGQWSSRHGVYTVNNSDRGKPKTRKLIPTKNTLHIKNDNLTIAGALKSAGYTTCHIGKWHVTKDPTQNGFDINIGGNQRGGPYTGGYHSPFKYPNCEQKEKGEYLTDRLTQEAISFINKNKSKPFFLHLAYYTVHTPIQAKKEKVARFKKKSPTKAHSNPTYAAMISSLDDNIGKLMGHLKESGLLENTLIIFTSDNGGVWNISKQWPLRAGKGAYYEGGIREPLVISWKGQIKEGQRIDTAVTGLDYFPTILAAVKVEKPKGKILDGANILPLAQGKDVLTDRALYWHFPIYLEGGNKECQDSIFRTRPGSAIRVGNWKLIEYFENGDLELYKLNKDPGEKQNLLNTFPSKAKELQQMLIDWRKKTNAPVPTELNPAFKK
ncbi:MAG: sulfatase [Akkermansiaceae bacterium]